MNVDGLAVRFIVEVVERGDVQPAMSLPVMAFLAERHWYGPLSASSAISSFLHVLPVGARTIRVGDPARFRRGGRSWG